MPEGLPCCKDSVLYTISDISSAEMLNPRYFMIDLDIAVEMDALEPRPDAIGIVDLIVRVALSEN